MRSGAPDTNPDIQKVSDDGETVGMMEPMLIGESSPRRSAIADLALELAEKAAGFRRSLPPSIAASLADLVRSMNCYYSNLIEGHDTHPIDIERALEEDYSQNAERRDLQLEARAHIVVQKWIDGGGLTDRVFTWNGLRETHSRFCSLLPEELLWAKDREGKKRIKVVPGELRTTHIKVGNHIAISPPAIPRFLARFEEAYGGRLGRVDSILAAACAHHRLVWIHPFLDGNGRVARLLSHAALLGTLETGALWSVARGLARNVEEYKRHLANCDQPRRNDLDGRGTLSEEMLAEFVVFFLKTCIDQVDFMETLTQPDQLRVRIAMWAETETRLGNLPPKAKDVLEALQYRGELPRGDLAGIVGTGDRQARRIVSALSDHGVIASESTRAPIRLAFPARLAGRWMPGLFPDKVGEP